jgi:hypothetical protein
MWLRQLVGTKRRQRWMHSPQQRPHGHRRDHLHGLLCRRCRWNRLGYAAPHSRSQRRLHSIRPAPASTRHRRHEDDCVRHRLLRHHLGRATVQVAAHRRQCLLPAAWTQSEDCCWQTCSQRRRKKRRWQRLPQGTQQEGRSRLHPHNHRPCEHAQWRCSRRGHRVLCRALLARRRGRCRDRLDSSVEDQPKCAAAASALALVVPLALVGLVALRRRQGRCWRCWRRAPCEIPGANDAEAPVAPPGREQALCPSWRCAPLLKGEADCTNGRGKWKSGAENEATNVPRHTRPPRRSSVGSGARTPQSATRPSVCCLCSVVRVLACRAAFSAVPSMPRLVGGTTCFFATFDFSDAPRQRAQGTSMIPNDSPYLLPSLCEVRLAVVSCAPRSPCSRFRSARA